MQFGFSSIQLTSCDNDDQHAIAAMASARPAAPTVPAILDGQMQTGDSSAVFAVLASTLVTMASVSVRFSPIYASCAKRAHTDGLLL